ncbi:Serine/threonine-protein kinase Pkn1 [Thalassocella blandensis]|nr:Serine/threonine-protein kinase Pkn1 [Thalassocella blandensis]
MEDKKQAPENKTVFKPRASKQTGKAPNQTEKSAKAASMQASPPETPAAEVPDVEATVLKPRAPMAQVDAPQSESPAAAENAVELTRIQQSIRNQDSSKGFVLAKKTADEALSQNKIILNNRFVLESTLGGGGMGTVYKAKDLRKVEASDLNPHVAVKVLNDDFKNHPQAFITLQREASRSHILSHPNIVTVHDFDRDGDIIFMTMELLDGQSLDVYMRQHRANGLSLSDVSGKLTDLCNALAYAHSKNIVHSDLKPGNIFVTENGSKILDFGIARLVNDASEDFDAGELGALTPTYASLEMLQGKSPAAEDDIYALAVITYELLTGKHPFDRKSAEEAQQLGLKPTRIPHLNKQEWAAIENALAFKREDRTKSVEEFKQALLFKKRLPVFKLTTALLLLISAALGAMYYLAPDKVDTITEKALAEGQQCLEQKRYDCAIDAFKTVIELHPDHTEAKQLLAISQETKKNTTIETTRLALTDCLETQQDLVCAKSKLDALQNLAADSEILVQSEYQIQQFELNQRIEQQLEKANNCVNESNFDCAHKALNDILANSAEHEKALALKQHVNEQQARLQTEQNELDNQFNSAMEKGKTCLSSKNYPCAISHFDNATAIKPEETDARELAQTARFEQKIAIQNQEKAEAFVSKGQACLQKKNYTCAIANAESSLEILPNNAPAKRLKQNAQTELDNIKKSFSIQ